MEGREFIAGDFTVADTITGHAVIMSRRAFIEKRTPVFKGA